MESVKAVTQERGGIKWRIPRLIEAWYSVEAKPIGIVLVALGIVCIPKATNTGKRKEGHRAERNTRSDVKVERGLGGVRG